MQFDGSRVYRVKAVADMLDVSPATIYRAIESGQLDAYRIGGAVRIPGAALRGYLDECAESGYQSYVTGAASPAADDQDGTAAAATAGVEGVSV